MTDTLAYSAADSVTNKKCFDTETRPVATILDEIRYLSDQGVIIS
jgi:hypothetical protein